MTYLKPNPKEHNALIACMSFVNMLQRITCSSLKVFPVRSARYIHHDFRYLAFCKEGDNLIMHFEKHAENKYVQVISADMWRQQMIQTIVCIYISN